MSAPGAWPLERSVPLNLKWIKQISNISKHKYLQTNFKHQQTQILAKRSENLTTRILANQSQIDVTWSDATSHKLLSLTSELSTPSLPYGSHTLVPSSVVLRHQLFISLLCFWRYIWYMATCSVTLIIINFYHTPSLTLERIMLFASHNFDWIYQSFERS